MDSLLISISVLSYNSESTIIDTLESIYNQTYQKIELIISDDGSRDKTIDIAKEWLDSHKDRFINARLLTVEQNTGVPANCNRAVAACNGVWIKLIAADDCLLPSCINDNHEYAASHPDAKIIYSKYYEFESINEPFKDSHIPASFHKEFDTEASRQLKTYLFKGYNITPSLIIKKNVFEKVGGFIEKYKLFEDSPFLTKVLKSGTKIYFLPEYTVLYRVNNTSITKDCNSNKFYKETFMNIFFSFREEMVYPLFNRSDLRFWSKELSFKATYYFAIKVLRNRKNRITNILFEAFKILTPFYFLLSIKHTISRLSKIKNVK